MEVLSGLTRLPDLGLCGARIHIVPISDCSPSLYIHVPFENHAPTGLFVEVTIVSHTNKQKILIKYEYKEGNLPARSPTEDIHRTVKATGYGHNAGNGARMDGYSFYLVYTFIFPPLTIFRAKIYGFSILSAFCSDSIFRCFILLATTATAAAAAAKDKRAKNIEFIIIFNTIESINVKNRRLLSSRNDRRFTCAPSWRPYFRDFRWFCVYLVILLKHVQNIARSLWMNDNTECNIKTIDVPTNNHHIIYSLQKIFYRFNE